MATSTVTFHIDFCEQHMENSATCYSALDLHANLDGVGYHASHNRVNMKSCAMLGSIVTPATATRSDIGATTPLNFQPFPIHRLQ